MPRPASPLSAVGAAARMLSRCEVSRLARPLASSPSFRTRSPRTDMTSGAARPSRDDAVEDLSPAYSASALATGASRSPKIMDRNRLPRSVAGVFASPPVVSMLPMFRPRLESRLGSVSRLMICRIMPESPVFPSRPLSTAGMAAESPRETPLSGSPRSEAARAVTSGVTRPRTVSRILAIAVPLSSKCAAAQAARSGGARALMPAPRTVIRSVDRRRGSSGRCKATASPPVWEAHPASALSS